MLVIGLNVIVFALYGVGYFAIKKNTATLATLAQTAATDTQKDETLHTIKSSLSENQGFIGEINSFFIPSDGVVGFINTLESLGKSTGVTLSVSSVDVGTVAPGDFKEPLHLRLETEGSWAHNYYFLSTLENLPYVLTINSATYTLSSAADSILFKGSATSRIPAPDETWKGVYDVTVLKLN